LTADEYGRGGLGDSPFSLTVGGGDKVFISWRGNQVMVLKGDGAASFMRRIVDLDAEGQQRAMAKISGNFKRGKER